MTRARGVRRVTSRGVAALVANPFSARPWACRRPASCPGDPAARSWGPRASPEASRRLRESMGSTGRWVYGAVRDWTRRRAPRRSRRYIQYDLPGRGRSSSAGGLAVDAARWTLLAARLMVAAAVCARDSTRPRITGAPATTARDGPLPCRYLDPARVWAGPLAPSSSSSPGQAEDGMRSGGLRGSRRAGTGAALPAVAAGPRAGPLPGGRAGARHAPACSTCCCARTTCAPRAAKGPQRAARGRKPHVPPNALIRS